MGRSTLFYRLKKIRELTHMDPEKLEDPWLNLYLRLSPVYSGACGRTGSCLNLSFREAPVEIRRLPRRNVQYCNG